MMRPNRHRTANRRDPGIRYAAYALVALAVQGGCRKPDGERSTRNGVPGLSSVHIAPQPLPSSTVIDDSKPGRALAHEGAAYGIFDSGCLYWSGKQGVLRYCERAKRPETVLPQGSIGPLQIHEQKLYFLRNRGETEATLSSFTLKTRQSKEVARLHCAAEALALVPFESGLLVAGNCDPEMSLVTADGAQRPFAHPDEQHPLARRIEPLDSVRALTSAQGWVAWISQRRVYLGDPGGSVRRIWGQRDATTVALSATELYFAHASPHEDPTRATIIESIELKSGVMRTIAANLGPVVALSSRGNALFFIQKPNRVGQIDLPTGTITIIGKGPPDSQEVVSGDDSIYTLSPSAGVFAFTPLARQ